MKLNKILNNQKICYLNFSKDLDATVVLLAELLTQLSAIKINLSTKHTKNHSKYFKGPKIFYVG